MDQYLPVLAGGPLCYVSYILQFEKPMNLFRRDVLPPFMSFLVSSTLQHV